MSVRDTALNLDYAHEKKQGGAALVLLVSRDNLEPIWPAKFFQFSYVTTAHAKLQLLFSIQWSKKPKFYILLCLKQYSIGNFGY